MASIPAAAQAAGPKTVTDFYYALPPQYFRPAGGEVKAPGLREYRASIIKTEDVKNGYLSIEEPLHEGWSEAAIFKQTDGGYLVGVVTNGCGPGCTTEEIAFLSYERGNWRDVTAAVLPPISTARLEAAIARQKNAEDLGGTLYELPRVGTTVAVRAGCAPDADTDCPVIFELKWNGSKFILQSK